MAGNAIALQPPKAYDLLAAQPLVEEAKAALDTLFDSIKD